MVVGDHAALVGNDADALQAQALGERTAADGDQHVVGLDRLGGAAGDGLDRQLHALGRGLRAGDLRAQLELEALLGEDLLELGGHFGVGARQDAVQELDHGHLGAQALPDRAQLQADDAGADDDQRAWQVLHFQKFVAVDHRPTIKRHVVGAERTRADREQDALGADLNDIVIVLLDLQRIGRNEARLAAHVLHAVAGKLVFENFHFVVERDQQAAAQIVGADLLLDAIGLAVKAALAPAGQVQRRLAQRFRRDRTGMNRDATDPAALLDNEHFLVELGCLDGGAAAGRAAADDDKVILVHEMLRSSKTAFALQ